MKKFMLLPLSIAFIILSTSCKTKHNSRVYGGYPSGNELESKDVDKFNESGRENRTQKIIYSARITLAVDEPSVAYEKLKEIATDNGGYVSVIGTYSSVIRVKSEKMDTAIANLEGLGKVKSKSMNGKDVIDEYRDYQIRLENAEKARDRYLELLSQAENVEAALKVEVELERLNETIELLKGKIHSMDHLSEYSTITIYINERKKPGILGYIGLGLYHSVKWLFVRN